MVAGIDYSMSSPAICVFDTSKKLCFNNTKVFVYTKKTEVIGNIYLMAQRPYSSQEERFDNIGEWALSILKQFNVKRVCLEGYAMGSSKGLVFNIGENGGVLKNKLFKAKIELDCIPAPTQVKKHFTGKGNSNKEAMYNVFYESEKINLIEKLNIKTKNCYDSPISDIVDSYAMTHFLLKGMEN